MSTNDMYIPTAHKTKRGRYRCYLRKSDLLKEFQDKIEASFEHELIYKKEFLKQIADEVNRENKGLNLYIKISMPAEEYWNPYSLKLMRKDSSNYFKSVEDAIYKGIGIDDHMNIKVTVEKGFNEDFSWYIEAHIKETSVVNRIDADVMNSCTIEEIMEVMNNG